MKLALPPDFDETTLEVYRALRDQFLLPHILHYKKIGFSQVEIRNALGISKEKFLALDKRLKKFAHTAVPPSAYIITAK